MIECSICGDKLSKDINGFSNSHNPEPVTDGRCCDECNLKVVLPYRIMLMKGDE